MRVCAKPRQTGIRQHSVQPRFGRATVLAFVLVTGAVTTLPASATAQDLSWDTISGNTAVDGGSGNWDDTTANWTGDAGVTNEAWVAGNTATFGGTAGTVTVVGTQETDYITVQTDGYTLQGGALTFSTSGSSGVTVETGTTTIATDMTSTNGFNKAGNGTLILSGSNSLAGTLNVSRGNLVATNADALSGVNTFIMQSSNSALNVDLGGATLSIGDMIVNSPGSSSLNNGTVSFSGLAQVGYGTINAVLAGTGELRKTLEYTTVLNGVNTLTGPVNVNEGQLVIGATGSILDTSGITIAAAGALYAGGAGGNAISDTGTIDNSGIFILSGSDETVGSIFGSGDIDLRTHTLTADDTTNATISGEILGAGDLVKQGSGTLILSGTNTATGTLTTSAGTTVVSGTWAGDVQNNANFDLIGTSTVNGTFYNNSAGSITNSGGGAVTLTGLADFIANGSIGSATGSITVSTENMTYRNGHSETGTVTFDVSDTITEERTTGPTWQGTGYTANFATAVDGIFTTGGDFTTTGGFTHDSTAALTVSAGDTMTVASMTNTNGSVINVEANASLVGTGNTTDNSGTVNVAGGGSLVELTGDYNNLSTGVVNFNDADAKIFDVQAGVISNTGTLNFNAGTTTVNSGGGAIQNSGTGTINIADNATLDASGDTINNTGTIDMLGTGSVLIVDTLTNTTGGVVNAQGAINADVINQGTGDFNIVGNLLSPTLNITNTDAATLDVASGTISVFGNLTNTTTSGTGVTVAAGAGLNAAVIQNGVSGGSAASLITNNGGLYSDTSIINYAGATLNSNTTNSLIAFENTLTNNGTVNIQGRIGGSAVVNSGADAAFNVVGDLNLNNVNPLNAFTNQNSAVLNVTGGTFWVDALTNTSGGTGTTLATAGVQIAADGGLVVAGAVANNGSGTINNAGTIDADTITNGDGTNAATLTNTGTLTSAATTGTGMSNAAGSTLVSTGTIDADASADAAAFLNAGVADIAGTLLGNVTNTGDFEATGDLDHTGAFINDGSGTTTVSAGVMATSGDFTNNSTVMGTTLGAAGVNIDAGATLEALNFVNSANASTVVAGTLHTTSGANDAISNLGTMVIDATGSALGAVENNGSLTSLGAIDGTVSNTATLNLQGVLDGDLVNDGGATTITGILTGTGGASTGMVTNQNAATFLMETGSLITLDTLDNDATSVIGLNNATIDGNVTNAGSLVGGGRVTGSLDNSGTVDMADGVTGDELRIESGLSGAGTYVLDLDLVSTTPGADALSITGATTGDLVLAFNAFAGTPLLTDTPLVVVDVDESANNDFTFSATGLPTGSGPIVVYASQAVPNGDILVAMGASLTLGGLLEGVAQVEALTNQSAGRLAPHKADICGGAGAWGRFTGGEMTGDATTENGGQSAGVEVVSDYQGFEIGANLGCASELGGWDLSYGVLGGMNSGTTTQTLGGDAPTVTGMDFEQLYAGLAASATRGALTADLQLRYGQTEYTPGVSAGSDAAALGVSGDTFTAQTFGLNGAVNYRIPVGQSGFAVVPHGGVSIASTIVDALAFDSGETLGADDFTQTSGYVGATVQYESITADAQGALNAFAGASYRNSLSGGQTATLTDTADSQASLTSSGLDGFAEISIGVDYTSQIDVNRQFSVGLRADSRIGDNVEGYAVAFEVGLRF